MVAAGRVRGAEQERLAQKLQASGQGPGSSTLAGDNQGGHGPAEERAQEAVEIPHHCATPGRVARSSHKEGNRRT